MIIDVHHLFFTKNTLDGFKKLYSQEFSQGFAETNPERFKHFQNLLEPAEQALKLKENMKANGVDQILPMAFNFDTEGAFIAHKKYPESFPGIIPFLDPEHHPDPHIVEEWKKNGAVGVKFYPGQWKKTKFSDETLLPYLEALQENGLTPLIHFGVMKGGPQVGWPSNPLELKPWLQNRKLSELNFVIAHFGAGFLREVLLMAYGHGKRIYVDTSGSNDWIFWSPWTDLTYVFEKTIKAMGSSHLLFGSDSGLELLRSNVILRQKGILQDLLTKNIIKDEDVNNILSENAKRILKI